MANLNAAREAKAAKHCNAQDSAWQHAPERTCGTCGETLSDCQCYLDEDEPFREDTDSLEDRGLTLGSYGS